MRIGFCGFSSTPYNKTQAAILLKQAVDEARKHCNPDTDLIFVSGLTNLGIPGQAYELAALYDAKTIGIACAKATHYDLFPCDQMHIIGADWGDESETFLTAIDLLIRVGGGSQSLSEIERAKELGIPVIEKDLPKDSI